MHIIEPSYSILAIMPDDPLAHIEAAGRTCYKSEAKIGPGTAEKFVRMILSRGHESVVEHASMSVRFVCDRGVSHELVRHRLCAFSQESTRYCNYSRGQYGGDLAFICPPFFELESDFEQWRGACSESENIYLSLVSAGAKPEQARSVLPNSLKTEIVVTANLREWRHIFRLRTSAKAHPQMRELMRPLLRECRQRVPVLFEDVGETDE